QAIALVGTQPGQTLLVGGRNPLVAATVAGSVFARTAIVQIPGVSQFFGCTPWDPLAWGTVVTCAAESRTRRPLRRRRTRSPRSGLLDAQQPTGPGHQQRDQSGTQCLSQNGEQELGHRILPSGGRL